METIAQEYWHATAGLEEMYCTVLRITLNGTEDSSLQNDVTAGMLICGAVEPWRTIPKLGIILVGNKQKKHAVRWTGLRLFASDDTRAAASRR